MTFSQLWVKDVKRAGRSGNSPDLASRNIVIYCSLELMVILEIFDGDIDVGGVL